MGEKDDRLARVRSNRPPPWPTVIKTTLVLWLRRRASAKRAGAGRSGTSRPSAGTAIALPAIAGSARARRSANRRRLLGLSAVVVIAGLAAALAVALTGRPGPGAVPAAQPGKVTATQVKNSDPPPPPTAASLQASALARGQAAAWVAAQVSPDAIVSCDPAMCSVLQAHGVPSSHLLVLLLADADPLGSDVVVATSVVRDQFGASLISVYAPEVLASFGSGTARIDIRAIASAGGQAYNDASVAADLTVRAGAGRQLLRNSRISTSPAARAQLAAGDVDPRLLAMLAALGAQQQVSVVAFGDPSPGAPQVPLRGAELKAATLARLRSMQSFLRAQRTPFLPAQLDIITTAGGQHLLNIEYDAPGPLGMGGN